MSRDFGVVFGFLLLHLAYVTVGAAVMYVVGLLGEDRRPLAIVWAVGPAYLIGVAVTVCAGSALLTLGIPIHLWVLLLVSIAVVAGSVWLRRTDRVGRVAPARLELRNRYEVVLLAVAAAAGAFYAVWAAVGFMNAPVGWDAAHVWSLRGVALYHFETLEPRIFENPAFESLHLAYPVGQPLLEATSYRSWGHVDVRLWHVELWLFWVGAVWSIAYLVAARTGRLAVAVAIPMIALVTPAAVAPVELAYADITAAAFFGVGALCLGLCIDDRRPGWALLAGLLLAAGANVKNEGLAYAAVALAVAAVVLLARYGFRRALVSFGWAAVPFAVLVAPWRIWLRINGPFPGDQRPILDSLDWGFLTDRWFRVQISVRTLITDFLEPQWALLVPLFVAAAILCLVVGHRRALTGYYLAAVIGGFASLIWVYWTGYPPDVALNLNGTAWRVPAGMVLAAAAGLTHLVASLHADTARALTGGGEDPGSTAGTTRRRSESRRR